MNDDNTKELKVHNTLNDVTTNLVVLLENANTINYLNDYSYVHNKQFGELSYAFESLSTYFSNKKSKYLFDIQGGFKIQDALDYCAKNLVEGCVFVNPLLLGNKNKGFVNGHAVHFCSHSR